MTTGNGYLDLLMFIRAPRTVVSLVPSMTESLFDLDLGDRLVGVTEYCQPPAPARDRLSVVGGTKSPSVEQIIELAPDLVLANQEENTPEAVEALEAAGLKVWVSFPRSVAEAIQVLWAIIKNFKLEGSPVSRIRTLELTVDWARQAADHQARARVFCPIWQDRSSSGDRWWMTFNRETYAHDLLHVCGGANVFADRKRRNPLAADLGRGPEKAAPQRDQRYPRVTLQEIEAGDPEVILLPSEPYAFGQADAEEICRLLPNCTAVQAGRVHLVDGSLVTWHGTRLAKAIGELPAYFHPA